MNNLTAAHLEWVRLRSMLLSGAIVYKVSDKVPDHMKHRIVVIDVMTDNDPLLHISEIALPYTEMYVLHPDMEKLFLGACALKGINTIPLSEIVATERAKYATMQK